MRFLCCLLLGSVLLSGCGDPKEAVAPNTKSSETVTLDEQPKTANETQAAAAPIKTSGLPVPVDEDAVAAIEKLGGKVQIDSLFGVDYVAKVDLSQANATDATFLHLNGLTNMRDLRLGGTMTDSGLEHLKGLTSLTVLTLRSTKVTDRGLVHLKGLKSLITLFLHDTEVTDAGLVHLDELTSLQMLDISGTKVTGTGLVQLKTLTNLYTLLLGPKVSDAGLVHLKLLTSLKMLSLHRNNKVTDAGLVHLKDLTSLQSLYLQGTSVTTAGVKDLQSALPKCRIFK